MANIHQDWCSSGGNGAAPCNCGAELIVQGFMLNMHERAVVALLGQAWSAYLELPAIHPNDQQEFMQAIHAAENVVCARPAVRQLIYARIQAEHAEKIVRENGG